MLAYTVFTIKTTAWRTKFRKQANAADNKGATVAVDSLINYEAVKVAITRFPAYALIPSLRIDSISITRSTKWVGMTKPLKVTRAHLSK